MANIATGMDEPRKPQGSLPIPKSRRGLKGFLSEVGRELKKVSWPTRAETFRLTGVVLGVCAMVVSILTGLSYAFGEIIHILTKGF